jgi:23S rRNA (pseudouridine1915-N3)-methyltransferase
MIKIKIYTIGRCKESWLQEALSEYEKRLSSIAEIEWILAKNFNELKLPPSYIALDVQGELLDSPTLSKRLMKTGSRLHFLIGDADGLPPTTLQSALFRWSLSPLTFTHQMTRLILLEQLYRAFEIEAGSKYHK